MASFPDLAVIDQKSLGKDWKPIGRGGFGQVFKARHLQWRRDVAIKLLVLDDGLSDLLRESKLMQRAESPHVTQVLGVFRGRPPAPSSAAGIQIGLVLELMERGSLSSLQIKRNRSPLPWSLVCRLAHQVALGMNHLHILDIIHKDLKPDNVLLDKDLNAKITDFGLSKLVDTVTSAGIKGWGTTKYKPPEAFSLSNTSTPAFDVYSYGILLWFIVTGKKPYEGATNNIIQLRIPMGDRPSLDAINTEQVPEMKDLVQLMQRCWVHEPDQRPLFEECTAVTEALYERNKPGMKDAVDHVTMELDITDGIPGPDLRIVIIGKCGVGKSASGNTILGEKRFDSRASDRSVTEGCSKASIIWNRMISVVDTPGVLDTHRRVGEITHEIVRCIQLSSPGPHVFLLAIQVGRFTNEEKNAVKALQKLFGPEVDKYMMVLFTRGDDLEDDDVTIQQHVEDYPALQQLIQRCGGRFHVFNNRSKDRTQVLGLIRKIDHMVSSNGGSFYTNEMYRAAEREIEEQKNRTNPENTCSVA